ncbi:TetR/AcrR family transcriptional regulator [Streptomyces sp. SID3343]|uniref:TetR/AcrR family transcriptional regulator n=1 Tax=Streptomyces sp. SID3343 TaxID=2690260 RepID=UPI00136EC671|nr:TetR/AcrR family transcriptional regulator [Streptomyces sp. SID3343]MYW01763.1 TetR family transcriptional regulator [Streptomyces sp. SID3343]
MHKPSDKSPGHVGDVPADTNPAALRADARRNRELILDAAREVFAARGVDAPISAVARRAGVGVATLYRRFPTRAALTTAAFDEQLTLCAAAFDEALADPDPGHGLYVLLEKVCATQVTDRGFASVFMDRFPDTLGHDRERHCAEERLAHLVRRAREAGQLRDDFDPADITLLLLANNGLAGQPPEAALAASRRLLAYLFQAFRTPRPGSLPPPAAMELHGLPRPPTHR